jgi:hypothetical protein
MAARDDDPYPTADEIAALAHELFTSGGRRMSMIQEYWRAAERELLQRAADRFIEADRRRSGAHSEKRRTTR